MYSSKYGMGAEPWKTYFEDMLLSSAASKTPSIKLTDPTGQRFDSQGFNSKFISDGLTAYTQAILYYVTGDNAYRKNAVTILRNWGGLDPDEYAYFSDAHIHTGDSHEPHVHSGRDYPLFLLSGDRRVYRRGFELDAAADSRFFRSPGAACD